MAGTNTKPRVKSGYLPSLDGWRALAILGVLMAHDQPWRIGRYSNAGWKGYGGSGVALFFALSGVLICWRVLEDEAAKGVFRLKDFYVRRVFRIQPAALAYLSLIAILIVAGVIHEWWHFWFGGLFLYQNFLFHTQDRRLIFAGYFTGHFWTLSVEEHFYILLSLCLYLTRRYRVLVLASAYLALYLAQHWARTHGVYSEDVSTRRTYWVLSYLVLPAILALLLRLPRIYAAAQKWLQPWIVFSATLVLLCADLAANHHSWRFLSKDLLGFELGHLERLLGFWVIATMLHPRSWSTRFLELFPLRYIGRLSYSIYVWHLLFLCATEPETHITWAPLVFVSQRPWRYIGILGVAMLSYYFIEKPMIRLGHKLAPPATPGHRDLDVEPEKRDSPRDGEAETKPTPR